MMQRRAHVQLPVVPATVQQQLSLQTDGLDRPLDIVLEAKLQNFQSEAQVPYWKHVLQKEKRCNAQGSDAVRLKRSACSLGRDMQNLLRLHERQESVLADLRHKLKELRREYAAKERQLDLAHRTIERMTVGKSGLEAGAAADKAYIRQLESRLQALKGAVEVEARLSQLRGEADGLRFQLRDAEQRCAAAEEKERQQRMDSEFLRRGIELAAEQLTRAAGADVSTTMLLAVARGQEEAVGLSQQLAEIREQGEQMAAALEAARTHLQAQHEALLQWKEWEGAQLDKTQALEEALAAERASGEALQREVEGMRPAVEDAEERRRACRQQLELERTARMDAEHQAEALQAMLLQQQEVGRAMRAEIQRLAAAEQEHLAAAAAQRRLPSPAQAARPAPSQLQSPGQPAPRPPFQRGASPLHRIQERRHQQQQQREAGRSPARSPAPPLTAGTATAHHQASLDDHIAALERELAELSAVGVPAPGAASRWLQAPPTTTTERAQPSPSPLPSPEPRPPPSPARAAYSAEPMWRSNPLASPEQGPRPAALRSAAVGEVAPASRSQSPLQGLAGLSSSSLGGGAALSEDAEWRLLERGLEEQRSADHRLQSLWQERSAASGKAGTAGLSQQHEEESQDTYSQASRLHATSSGAATDRPVCGAARPAHPPHLRLQLSIPGGDTAITSTAQGAASAPELDDGSAAGSSTAAGAVAAGRGRLPLPSPDLLGQHRALRDSADCFLNNSVEANIEQLEVRSAAMAAAAAKGSGAGSVVSVHAVAGSGNPAPLRQPLARQTLFDLANIGLP